MNDQPKRPEDKNVIRVEPATLVLIISALILLPLLLTGFISQ
ncbi:MAG TPA: hypothetical protein V6D07_03335 [Trichocoleus sp.]